MRVTKMGCLFAVSCLLMAGTVAFGAPQGGDIALGTGSIGGQGSTTNVIQSSNRMAVDWESFSIAEGERVEFSQPSATSVVMNRDFSGNASRILGDMVANGQVFVLNPAGVVIGTSGMVDTGGLLLSDMTLSLDDFRDDTFRLAADTRGGVVNQGDIRTGEGGLQLVAAFVDNQGSLRSDGGDIGVTVADGAVVSLGSSGRLGVSVSEPLSRAPETAPALINNTGDIVASGSDVQLTAAYLASLGTSPINNDGLVNAIAIDGSGGRIVLRDQPVSLAGDREQAGGNVLAGVGEDVDVTQGGSPPSQAQVPRLNELVADCNPAERNDRDCRRENAIKHYLGRMLINGRLPIPTP